MSFKQALGIESPGWTNIGIHLGSLVQKALDEQGKTAKDLTEYLMSQGHRYIKEEYVMEYLDGSVSFGCFFPQVRDFLDIPAEGVLPDSSPAELMKHLKRLDEYLGDLSNPESLTLFLKYGPGEELRNHVAETLRKGREEALAKPYHSIEVGLENRDEERDRKLLEALGGYKDQVTALTDGKPNSLVVKESEGPNYAQLVERLQEAQGDSRYGLKIHPGSRVVIQPAFIRGRKGITIDFFDDGEYFDRGVAEHLGISIGALKQAYTEGVFDLLEEETGGIDKFGKQEISNICMVYDCGVDQLVPTRDPTEAEKYEIHQRWLMQGGMFVPGQHVKGPQEIERQMQNRPDPNGPSEFEETAYNINSYLSMVLSLFDHLPQLVRGNELIVRSLAPFLLYQVLNRVA